MKDHGPINSTGRQVRQLDYNALVIALGRLCADAEREAAIAGIYKKHMNMAHDALRLIEEYSRGGKDGLAIVNMWAKNALTVDVDTALKL